MSGSLSRADIRADLKDSLHDAASVLADPADFDRCLAVALAHLAEVLPRTLAATLTLSAGVSEYAVPADYLRFKMALWGRANTVQPWDKAHPGRLPDIYHVEDVLLMVPAPSARQIGLLGSDYRFYYFAGYTLDETVAANTTLPESLRGLLLLRAQAECCKELAMRNVSKPVTMRDAGGQPKNGTPSHLYKVLLDEFMVRVTA